MRLILPTETLSDRDKASIAGKKMKDDRGENVAAKEAKNSISPFCLLVQTEYGGEDSLEADSSVIEACSFFSEAIDETDEYLVQIDE